MKNGEITQIRYKLLTTIFVLRGKYVRRTYIYNKNHHEHKENFKSAHYAFPSKSIIRDQKHI